MSFLSPIKGVWELNKPQVYTYTGELDDSFPDALIIDNKDFADGRMSAEFSYIHSDLDGQFHTAGFIFRYRDPLNYYFAGIGGYNRKFVIGKRTPAGSVALAVFGNGKEIISGEIYNLEVKFSGTNFELFLTNNGGKIRVLEAVDIPSEEARYPKGNIGLTVYGHSQVRITNYSSLEEKSKWFIITQFDENWSLIEEVIKALISGTDEFGPFNAEYITADKIYSNSPIISDIRHAIASSSLLIVDLSSISKTRLGKKIHGNANVFYELGIAHSINPSNTILICEESDTTQELPFDIKHLRVIKYKLKEGKFIDLAEFKQKLDQTIKNIMKGSTIIKL